MENESLDNAKKRALKILGSRNLSEKEMIDRLTRKGETLENAQEATAWLVELGYINDSDYGALIVTHYCEKGYGRARIRDELSRRGIPRDLWDDVLEELDESEMEDAANRFLSKKLNGSTEKDDIRRATDALVRRGFSYDEAKNAVNFYIDSLQ